MSDLAVKNLSFRRQNTTVFRNLSFKVPSSQVLAVLGPSGSGKSTLLRVLVGLAPPTNGQVLLGGKVISEAGRVLVPPHERQMAMVFQDLALWPHLTVYGNLRFVLKASSIPGDEHSELIHSMLSSVELSGLKSRYPSELSGGEQQRVAIARALVTSPKVLLLDEPLTGLDPHLRQSVLELLGQLIEERHTTTIYVTHNPTDPELLGAQVLNLKRPTDGTRF